jgi:hypothetical protein
MRSLFITIFIFFSLSSFSQTFNGVSISGSLNEVVKKFEQKGYKLDKYIQGTAIMNGTIAGKQIEIYIASTPKSKQVWKISGYFNKHESWANLKSEYENYCNIINDKYGNASNAYSYFLPPYESGDGYELQAVKLEKASFSSFWLLDNQNLNIGVSIEKFQQVRISYENIKLSEVYTKEQSEIEADAF